LSLFSLASIPIFSIFLILIFILQILNFEKRISKNQVANYDWSILGILGGLLPLARPEAVIVSILGGAFIYFLTRRHEKRVALRQLAVYTGVFIAIAAPYYIYLFLQTSQLIPSSVFARSVLYLRGNVLLKLAKSLSPYWRYWMVNLLYVASFLGLIFMRGTKLIGKTTKYFFLGFILAFLPIWFIGLEPRYITSAFPVLTLLSAYCVFYIISNLMRRKSTKLLLIVLLIIAVSIELTGSIHVLRDTPRYSPDTVLEKGLATFLNAKCKNNQPILTYEVQEQYYLKCPILSMDGIIGGEINPFFARKSNLIDFLMEYKPRFFVNSDILKLRKEYSHTVLRHLSVIDSNLRIGQRYSVDGIVFTKVLQNQRPCPRWFNCWRSVYVINYQ